MQIRGIANYDVEGHQIFIYCAPSQCVFQIHYNYNWSNSIWIDDLQCMQEVEEELIALKRRLPKTKLTKARFDFFFNAVLRKGAEPKHETIVLD